VDGAPFRGSRRRAIEVSDPDARDSARDAEGVPAGGAQSVPSEGAQSVPAGGTEGVPVGTAQSVLARGAEGGPAGNAQSGPVGGAQSAPAGEAQSVRGVEGSIFDAELPNGRAHGLLRVQGGQLVLDADGRRHALPLRGTRLRRGGAADRILFFAHPTRPERTLFTSDRRILASPELRADPDLARDIAAVEVRRLGGAIGLGACIAGVLALVIGAYLAVDPLLGLVTRAVPTRIEERLGEAAFSQIALSSDLVESERATAALAPLLEPLRRELDGGDYRFRFHVSRDPQVNAFALPGGIVVLHSGLLLEADSAEQVLGVIAHELAHVTERHSLRQLIGAAGLYVGVQMMLGDVGGVIAVLANGGISLARLQFSRDFEREADDVGFARLERAGIDPHGMIEFFEKLAEREEQASVPTASLAWLSTHPSSQERFERLRARLAGGPPAPALPIDYAAFKEQIRVLVAKSDAVRDSDSEGE
jgi:beta-barrel assembly-enhancing protease